MVMRIESRMNNQPSFGAGSVIIAENLEKLPAFKKALPKLYKMGDNKVKLDFAQSYNDNGVILFLAASRDADKVKQSKTLIGKLLQKIFPMPPEKKYSSWVNLSGEMPKTEKEVITFTKKALKIMKNKAKASGIETKNK